MILLLNYWTNIRRFSDKQLIQISDYYELYDVLSRRNDCKVKFVDGNDFNERQEAVQNKLNNLKQNNNERDIDL